MVHDQLRLAENRHAAYSLAYKTGAFFLGHFGGKNPRLIVEEIRYTIPDTAWMCMILASLGPVVHSFVSLTSSLRGQLVKCFTSLYPNTLKFFVEKMREAFALQKLLTFFRQKILTSFRC